MENLLEVKNLSVTFRTLQGEIQAVRDVSFDIKKGSVTAIVGESGCGKSVTSKSIMGLVKPPGFVSEESKILFQGENIQEYTQAQWEDYRGQKCSICFQDALTALNPTMTIGKQIMEKILVHKKVSKKQAWDEAVEVLARVGIPNPELRMKQYPHEFSGGMRQRVMIGIAVTLNPALLIADEPTTALDVTIQAQVLELISHLKEEIDSGIIMITHDLGVVASICDRIAIMYGGKIVETGTVFEIFEYPQHPYTIGLLSCISNPNELEKKELHPIPGSPPDLLNIQENCPFADRCASAMKICKLHMPQETQISATHRCSCWLQHPKACKGGEVQ